MRLLGGMWDLLSWRWPRPGSAARIVSPTARSDDTAVSKERARGVDIVKKTLTGISDANRTGTGNWVQQSRDPWHCRGRGNRRSMLAGSRGNRKDECLPQLSKLSN